MSNRPPSPGCSTCGKPPTSSAQDIKETSRKLLPNGDMLSEYAADGPARYGCDEHPVASRCRRLSGAIE